MSKEKMTMTRCKATAALFLATLSLGILAGSSAANEGVFRITPGSLDQTFTHEDGSEDLQAGSHPFAVSNEFKFDSVTDPTEPPTQITAGASPRRIHALEYPGLIGNPFGVPQCSQAEFFDPTRTVVHCTDEAQVGIATVTVKGAFGGNEDITAPLYNLEPNTGVPAEFGFWALIVPVKLVAELRSDGDYGITVKSDNIDETLNTIAVEVTFWGVPGAASHEGQRGGYFVGGSPAFCATDNGSLVFPPCPYHGTPKAFLTTPVDCAHGPMETTVVAESWLGEGDSQSVLSHDDEGNPAGMEGCDRVPFEPTVQAMPTNGTAETATGLKFTLGIPDDGIRDPKSLAQSTMKKAVVTLPEGMTLNPSAGEGLGACTPADFKRETLEAQPGEGCPNESKIGTVRIDTPLLDLPAEGSLYVASSDDPGTTAPGAENPFDSLLALYMVARVPERGIVVRAEGKVEPNSKTGQLVTTFDDLPPLPFSKFTLSFREGGRAPLATPAACGSYSIASRLTPYSAMGPDDVATIEAPFEIASGVGGGACASGGKPPWKPGLRAGTLSNSAGTYSPFNLRFTRNDGEQEFTNFSIKLPPGVIGKLAGIPFCPDSAIEVARRKSGTEELASPSCPAASEVGRTLVGAGVGTILTYVPGKLYLGGSYNGSALSIVAITAARVGPFDLGTVVIRQALKINPETAEVFVDPTGSDPIPHIIDGVVVHARDIRVYVDRPDFILNPTDCSRTSTVSTLLGSGLDFASAIDDEPYTVTSAFQAADCASLGFKPKLKLQLLGGTRRGDNPKLRATLKARPGDANIGRAQVTLPHSEFLDNEHIKTICTRVQFAAGEVPGERCPAASVYGYARAFTPLLDRPIQGPVFLRSSSHPLPDLVAALHNDRIDINLAGRIDSFGEGRIRTTFGGVPDAPVTKFVLTMQGGKKGLLINSENICKGTHRAIVALNGQNGKRYVKRPAIKPQCRKK
ncbi:MAG TPA: hypothetical protein VFN92_12215 [Solirubrobacterales bacterium]|nr:hypothetical protein [Solirubrobacterales bacterium]